MTGHTALRRANVTLIQSLGRDFERAALPFVRLFWPTTLQAIQLKEWDNQGIDLLCLNDNGRIRLAAQCKTCQKPDLGQEEVQDALASIEKFRRTGHKCDTYLFLINGDGRNPAYNAAIENELQRLIAEGRANQAEFWPRTTLLNRAFLRMKAILIEALRQQAIRRQLEFRELFRFGDVYLPTVPVKEEELILRLGSPCVRRDTPPKAVEPLADRLHATRNARWTLLTGVFGAGKTTTALQASSRGKYTSLFVAASELGRRTQIQGTATIGQEIVDTLRIFGVGADPIDGFFVMEEKDEETFTTMAGPALASILRNETPDHILVIDGLDENRLYLRPEGFQLLNNQLAELKCPIVLTTRLEHLSAMFGNFESLLGGLGSGRRSATPARLLTLNPWTAAEVTLFVEAAHRNATGEEQARLALFSHALREGRLTQLYGDLPFHPLFLQFILDDVCSEGLAARRRTELIRSWVQRKIDRDIDKHGSPIDQPIDRYEIVGNIALLMEAIAGAMTEGGPEIGLAERIESRAVEQLSEDVFGVKVPISTLLLYGFIVPVDFRKDRHLPVRFVLRVLQEFFLARHIKRQGLAVDRFPPSVRQIVEELAGDI
jgi:hypothetical protein